MNRTRRWLADNAGLIMGAVAGFLLLSGAVGYWHGITEVPGKYGKPQPVWLLFVLGFFLLWIARKVKQQSARLRKLSANRSSAPSRKKPKSEKKSG